MRFLQAMLGGCDILSSLSSPPGLCSVGDDPDFLPFMSMGGSDVSSASSTKTKKPDYTPPDPKWDEHATKEDQADDRKRAYTPLPTVPDKELRLPT